jgi:hypothetical protein
MRRTMAVWASALWLVSVVSLGCAPTVQVGLANAPALGGTPIADTRVHDVIANGPDSCVRGSGPGAGRSRAFACGPATDPAAAHPVVIRPPPRHDAAAMRWVAHYYTRWPCRPDDEVVAPQWFGRTPSPYAGLACLP